MGRLKSVPSRLTAIAPRLKRQTDAEGHVPDSEVRKWYGSRQWKKLRLEVLLRDHCTCQCGCGYIASDTSELVADHKIPHRGVASLFWRKSNLWTLRANPCHNTIKQREEAAFRREGGGPPPPDPGGVSQ